MEDESMIEYKIIFLGDTSAGKTCLFKKVTKNIFLEKNVATVGIDRNSIIIECELNDNKKDNIMLTLTDTAGQERYKSITKLYYKDVDAVLLIYDITDLKSFTNVEKWVIEAREGINMYKDHNDYIIFLMGTKLDVVKKDESLRQVTEDEAEELCKKLNLEFIGENDSHNQTDEELKNGLFKNIAKILYKKIGIKHNEDETTIKHLDKPESRNAVGCCGNEKKKTRKKNKTK